MQPNLINKPKKKKKASAIPKTKKTNEIKINREIEKKTKEEWRVITMATIGGGVGVCHLVVDGWVRGSLLTFFSLTHPIRPKPQG